MFIKPSMTFGEVYEVVFSFVHEMSLHNDAGMHDVCYFIMLPNNYYAVVLEGKEIIKHGKVLLKGRNLYDLFCKGLKYYKNNRRMWYIFLECMFHEVRMEISNIIKFFVMDLGYDDQDLLWIRKRTIRDFVRTYDEEAWMYGK